VDRAKNKRMIGIPPQVLQDFNLFKIFIKNANKGININLCTYRCPTIAYRADACPQGLGGFSRRGRSWRFRIPTHIHFRATLNFLKLYLYYEFQISCQKHTCEGYNLRKYIWEGYNLRKYIYEGYNPRKSILY